MTHAELRVEGAPELARGLDHVADELGDLAEPGRIAANRIAEKARAAAPIDTGYLVSTIRGIAYPDVATVEATAEYAPFVHWGVPEKNIPARPFLTSALEAEVSETIATYTEYAQGLLDRVEGI